MLVKILEPVRLAEPHSGPTCRSKPWNFRNLFFNGTCEPQAIDTLSLLPSVIWTKLGHSAERGTISRFPLPLNYRLKTLSMSVGNSCANYVQNRAGPAIVTRAAGVDVTHDIHQMDFVDSLDGFVLEHEVPR